MLRRTPISIDDETAQFTRNEVGSHYAGWLSFRPLWDQIISGRMSDLLPRLIQRFES